MIYCTGDTHGEIDRLVGMNLTKNDYLIVAGDFGMLWNGDECDDVKLDVLSTLPFTICFIDGNHENFDLLNSYSSEYWNGGQVHKIRPNIIHLQRGYVFELDNKKIFCMGGAHSMDKEYRVQGVSWWQEEVPTNDEWERARKNLKSVGWKVDYVVTHSIHTSVLKKLFTSVREDSVMKQFKEISKTLKFKKWIFGHYHVDMDLDKYVSVYENFISLK